MTSYPSHPPQHTHTHTHTHTTLEKTPMTQEAADRIKETQTKKTDPDTGFIERTQEAAKKNEGK